MDFIWPTSVAKFTKLAVPRYSCVPLFFDFVYLTKLRGLRTLSKDCLVRRHLDVFAYKLVRFRILANKIRNADWLMVAYLRPLYSEKSIAAKVIYSLLPRNHSSVIFLWFNLLVRIDRPRSTGALWENSLLKFDVSMFSVIQSKIPNKYKSWSVWTMSGWKKYRQTFKSTESDHDRSLNSLMYKIRIYLQKYIFRNCSRNPKLRPCTQEVHCAFYAHEPSEMWTSAVS